MQAPSPPRFVPWRRPLHTAEVVRLALRQREVARREGRLEDAYLAALATSPAGRAASPLIGAAALAGAVVLGGAAVRGLADLLGNGNDGRRDEDEASERRRPAHLGARAGGGRRARADALR